MLSIGTPSLDRATDDDGQPKKKRGRSEENEANVINIDDDSEPMDLMFQLLQGTDRPEFDLADWDVSELKGIKVVADKYDMPTVPRLLAECLWVEVSKDDGYYTLGAFAVAVHFGHKHLARYACSQTEDHKPPSQFSWWTAQELGLEAYFILVTGESKCKPFSWKELSKRIFVSDQVQILESLSVESLYTALHSA
jgi:hypothetical protein